MWVQLIAAKHLDIDGKRRTYHPGDWVDVGKQHALHWIEAGEARVLGGVQLGLDADCGVLLRATSAKVELALKPFGKEQIRQGELGCPFPRTLLLDPPAVPRLYLIRPGFELVRRWDLALPLAPGYSTADSIGTARDREATKEVIHDLRVPVYDTRLMFLRQGQTTSELLDLWKQESQGSDERLAFLRALYQTRPLVLALPPEWLR